MKFLQRIFLLPFFLWVNYVFSTHISGGEITYKCIGSNQYLITLNLYRDCGGTLFSNTQPINLTSSCGTQSITAILVNSGGTEVSQICDEQISQSACNGGAQPGIQKFTFQATVTLLPCSDWKISWTDCCRNTTINVPTSGSDGSYIEAALNSAIDSCNSSPVFNSQPIPYVCVNQPVNFNWGVAESEGDSVTYSLVSAREDVDTNLTYTSPYSATNPIDGITINSLTGEISFTPTTTGNFIVAIQVNEYDLSGTLIGTIMRDIQFVVIACSNTPPPSNQGQITNLSGNGNLTSPYSIEICDGGSFSFTISYSDPDVNDTLTLTSNITDILPGAGFIATHGNPASAIISWTAPGNSTFFNSFTVFVNDGACPVPAIQSTNFQVSVIPATVAGPDSSVLCGVQSTQLLVTGGNNFTWSVISGDPIQVGINFSCNNCSNPVASPATTTFYEVTSDLISSTCPTKDTVQVKVVPEFTFLKVLNDSVICLFDSAQFEIIPDGTSSSYSYLWTSSNGNFDNNNISNPSVFFNSSGTKIVFVEITSAEGCIKKDSIQVEISSGQKPNIQIFADTLICIGDSTQLSTINGCPVPTNCGLSSSVCSNVPQTEAIIGAGNSYLNNQQYPAPFGNWYESAKHQILIRASELQSAGFIGGQISSLALNVVFVSGTNTYSEFEIKIGCTSLSSLSNWQSGLVAVFPAQTISVAQGWNTFNFTNSFDWDGQTNLIIDICFNNNVNSSVYEYTTNSPVFFTATNYNSVIYDTIDNSNNLCVSPSFPAVSTKRPNLLFGVRAAIPTNTYNYIWSPSANLNNDSISNPWAKPNNDISYAVIVYDTIAGCADTESVNISVAQNFNYTKSQSDTAICLNDSVQFIVSPDISDDYFFQWNPSAFLNFPNDSNPLAIITSAGNYTYYFSVSNGCEISDSLKITVSEGDIPEISISGNDSVCIGSSVQLTGTSVGGISSTYNFDWNGIATNDSFIVVSPVSDTSIVLIVSDIIGHCADTSFFTVDVLPIPDAQIAALNDSVCLKDDPIVFSATPNIGEIIWSGMGISSNGIFSPLQAGVGSHQIICAITIPVPPAFGCADNDTIVVNVFPNPAMPSVIADNPYCEFSVIDSLTAMSSGGAITWFADSQLTDTLFAGNLFKNISLGTNNISVYVTETSSIGCVSNPANWFEIVVAPNPQAAFVASPGEGFEPLQVSFSNNTQPLNSVNNYFWDFGGMGNSSSENPTFVFNNAGTYNVILFATDSNNCSDTFSANIIVFNESEIDAPNVFTPNGDGKNDVFKISAIALTEYKIEIFNRWGKKVFETDDENKSWDGKDLQGQKVDPGVYFYIITATDRLGNPIDKNEIKGAVTLLRD